MIRTITFDIKKKIKDRIRIKGIEGYVEIKPKSTTLIESVLKIDRMDFSLIDFPLNDNSLPYGTISSIPLPYRKIILTFLVPTTGLKFKKERKK
jgi:hypothetical protein